MYGGDDGEDDGGCVSRCGAALSSNWRIRILQKHFETFVVKQNQVLSAQSELN